MIKRIIFDIDYTLLVPNYSHEVEFFKNYYMSDYFMNNIGKVLEEYENSHLRYEVYDFLNYLNKFSKSNLDKEFLYNWFCFNTMLKKQDVSDSKELLEYCKNKKIEIVALTNWFTEVQKKKLEKVGLSHYFDNIYGGDVYLKPHLESYLNAIGNNQPSDCIMVGDNLLVDVMVPSQLGINTIHYTQDKCEHEFTKVKKLTEIKKYL